MKKRKHEYCTNCGRDDQLDYIRGFANALDAAIEVRRSKRYPYRFVFEGGFLHKQWGLSYRSACVFLGAIATYRKSEGYERVK